MITSGELVRARCPETALAEEGALRLPTEMLLVRARCPETALAEEGALRLATTRLKDSLLELRTAEFKTVLLDELNAVFNA